MYVSLLLLMLLFSFLRYGKKYATLCFDSVLFLERVYVSLTDVLDSLSMKIWLKLQCCVKRIYRSIDPHDQSTIPYILLTTSRRRLKRQYGRIIGCIRILFIITSSTVLPPSRLCVGLLLKSGANYVRFSKSPTRLSSTAPSRGVVPTPSRRRSFVNNDGKVGWLWGGR